MAEPIPAPLRTRIINLIAILLPFAGLAAAISLIWGAPFHWLYLGLLGGMYAVTMLGIGVGFHRLFTHRSFQTSTPVRVLWAALGSMAVEGPVLKWVAMHRKHHIHTDVPGDPHSPHTADHGDIGSVLRGLWHAHIGWMFQKDPENLAQLIPDLRKDRPVSFISRTFSLWVVLGLLIPAVVAGLVTGTWMGFLLGFLWGGLVRVLLVHHVTWSINSVCHLWGTRPFATDDHSRDNPIFGLLAFGEGWHNTHHAFPSSARHGLAWWKLDINYLTIRAMELLGLAHNVRRPAPERISERRPESAGRRGPAGTAE